jgi:peptide/nickel transport system substrate-binding protein
MLNSRRLVMPFMALCCALVLAACGAAVPQDTDDAPPQRGGTLTVGIESSWNSLDPVRVVTYNSFSVLLAIYEPLFDLTAEGETVPNLARGWKVEDDGLTYVVDLQEGVEFQDGTPFNADAVLANFERTRDPKNGCACLGNMTALDDIRAVDDHTVEFSLSRPSAGFPVEVLAAAPGLMASPKAIEETGGKIGTNPVGTGPFKLDREIPGSSVRFKKWDGYRDPERPYLDAVDFRIISDTDSRYSSLASTSIDVADNISPEWVGDAELDPSIKLDPQGAAGSVHLMLQNGEGSPLGDPRARQAACMAIDPERMNEALYNGRQSTGQQSPFPPGSPWDLGEVDGYTTYDPDRAREIVDELGGLSFVLQFTNNAGSARVAQALEAQWGYVGIDARVRPTDQPTLVEDALAHDFDAMMFRWRGSMDPNGNTTPWLHSSLATPDVPSANYNLVDDKELDALMMDAAGELDQDVRKEKYRAVSERLAEITPYCYLWGADWMRMSLVNVHDIPKRPDNIMQLRDAYIVE